MTLTGSELIAVFAGVGSLGSILVAIYGAYRTGQREDLNAKRTELIDLRAQVAVLADQMEHVLQDNIRLTRRVATLEAILIRHSIELPPDEMAVKK